ncbi:2-hexaprenyl-6-methoxy-1,4-benzoquinone methyltransferase [Fusarium falciforme]|nr:2-hexaprenyl-6-methoxy-1,4-benzoquinone methyltransferase [Fusarium falciforme]
MPRLSLLYHQCRSQCHRFQVHLHGRSSYPLWVQDRYGGEQDRVAGVFSRVAEFYDMSDLRSLGIHRLWKEYFISSLNPGATNPPGQPQRILDVVGGTGDIAFRHLQHSHEFNGNPSVHATI